MARFAPVVVQTLSDSEESDSSGRLETPKAKPRIHIDLADSSDDTEMIVPQMTRTKAQSNYSASTSFLHWQRKRADRQASPKFEKQLHDSRRKVVITPVTQRGKIDHIEIDDNETNMDESRVDKRSMPREQKPRQACLFSPTSTEAELINSMVKSDPTSLRIGAPMHPATNETLEAVMPSRSSAICEEQTDHEALKNAPLPALRETTKGGSLEMPCPSMHGLDDNGSMLRGVARSDVSRNLDVFTPRRRATTPVSPPPTFNTALEFQPLGRDSSPWAVHTFVGSRHQERLPSHFTKIQSSPEAPTFGTAPVYRHSTAQEQLELVNGHIKLLRTKIELAREVYRQRRLEHATFMASCRREMNRLTRWTVPTIRRQKRRFEDLQ